MRCNQDSSLAPYFAYAVLFHKTAKRVVCASRFLLVGLRGLEPPTSRLSGVRSNHLSYEPSSGGDEGNRTPDPLLAGQVLSQLSYTPDSLFAADSQN